MKIFLIGFMSCGKTTIGEKLANYLNLDFLDTDDYIEKQSKMSVNEIFELYGEHKFRQMERDLLTDLQNRQNLIVATGGGMPCSDDNIEMMLKSGKIIYLKLSPINLCQRLMFSQKSRPLIDKKTENEMLEFVTNLLKEREKFYKLADI
jgi:shikimate kinase